MKVLKKYKELFEDDFEDNWTSDVEEKQTFLTSDDEIDYNKWNKEWKIEKGEYTKLTSNKSGWVFFVYPELEPEWDGSPSFSEIKWEIDNDELKHGPDFLDGDHENMLANYIMFHLLVDEKVKIKWFMKEEDLWFTEELAMKYDNLFDYLILLKEAKKIRKAKKFNL